MFLIPFFTSGVITCILQYWPQVGVVFSVELDNIRVDPSFLETHVQGLTKD